MVLYMSSTRQTWGVIGIRRGAGADVGSTITLPGVYGGIGACLEQIYVVPYFLITPATNQGTYPHKPIVARL